MEDCASANSKQPSDFFIAVTEVEPQKQHFPPLFRQTLSTLTGARIELFNTDGALGAARGAALGAYNTLQSLGLFAGGALGGALLQWAGATGLFGATALLCALWLALTWTLQPVGRAPH